MLATVAVSARPRELALGRGAQTPLALITPGAARPDPELPDLLEHDWAVGLVCAVRTDALGEAALLGGQKSGGHEGYQGKGLLEVEAKVVEELSLVLADLGLSAILRPTSAPDAAVDEQLGYVAFRSWRWQTLASADRFYHPAARLVATGGAGSVSLTWRVPPDRFDRFRVVLRRASGSTPPATVTDGTGVTLSGNLATSVTDSGLAAGTYAYALFAQYDDISDTVGTVRATSASVTATATVT